MQLFKLTALAILLAGSLCFAPILSHAADAKAKSAAPADKEAQAQAAARAKRSRTPAQSLVLGGVSRTSMEINMDMVAITELEKLLSVPLKSMGLIVLDSPDFIALLAFLGPNGPFDSFNINRGRQYGVTLKANF